ncbi:hypothetical protein DV515_00001611, partial [Chloebia gouldiae]
PAEERSAAAAAPGAAAPARPGSPGPSHPHRPAPLGLPSARPPGRKPSLLLSPAKRLHTSPGTPGASDMSGVPTLSLSAFCYYQCQGLGWQTATAYSPASCLCQCPNGCSWQNQAVELEDIIEAVGTGPFVLVSVSTGV